MTDYTKTKIYKIESHLGDKIYIGSTAKQYLSQRFQQHKNSYKQWKLGKIGKINSFELFDEYGVENCIVVLIEEYPCNSKDAKNAREGKFIRELDCVNKRVEGRTQAEYQQSERGKDIIKKYRQSDKGKETFKNYAESEKGKEIISQEIKKYCNSEKGKEKRRQYYIQNKEKYAQRSKDRQERLKLEKIEQEIKAN